MGLPGFKGDKGDMGLQGVAGSPGPQGPKGQKGDQSSRTTTLQTAPQCCQSLGVLWFSYQMPQFLFYALSVAIKVESITKTCPYNFDPLKLI